MQRPVAAVCVAVSPAMAGATTCVPAAPFPGMRLTGLIWRPDPWPRAHDRLAWDIVPWPSIQFRPLWTLAETGFPATRSQAALADPRRWPARLHVPTLVAELLGVALPGATAALGLRLRVARACRATCE